MRATFIQLQGFNNSQTNTFNAVLSLAENKLNNSWRVIGNNDAADFFVTRGSDSQKIILRRNATVKHCPFCKVKECPDVCENKSDIVLSENRAVPLLSYLTKALNHVIDAAFEAESCVSNDVKSVFDAGQGILKYLQTKAEPTLITISSANRCIELYIDTLQGVYFCQSDLQQLGDFLTIKHEMLVTKLSIDQLNAVVTQTALSAKQLSDLTWYMAFNLSQGRLLKDHSDQDGVRLLNWPNLVIPGCQKYMKLAAFMLHNATSLSDIAAETAIPIAEVYNFYNACQLIGLVEKTTNTVIQETKAKTSQSAILSRIANHLKECQVAT